MTGFWLIFGMVALGLGSVLSCLAQSLRDLSRSTLEEIATNKNSPSGSARIARILDDVDGHAAAVGLPRILCNLVVTFCIVMWLRGLKSGNDSQQWWLEVSLGIVLSSLLLWVFGFLLPSAVSKHAGEATIYAWSLVLRIVYWTSAPFRPLNRLVDEIVRRLAGKEGTDKDNIEQELLSVVEDAQGEGKFDEVEREMIEAVVKFRNRTVAQVMTPRTEMEAMPLTNDLGQVTKAIRSIGHSRIPVYEGDLDHVVGVFYVKDLMRWLAGDSGGGSRMGKTFDFRELLRPCIFVPETKTIRELLPELLSKRVHIAMVADEYGGTAGLVTIEDIVEEVFGDIQDEYEKPEDTGSDIHINERERSAEVDARTSIEDANVALREIDVALPVSEDYATVAGFVTVSLGRIPLAGETFHFNGSGKAIVLAAEPTRVTRVRLEFANAREGAGV
jgi:CBS domain containing-hemolysin-like protein